MFDNLAKGELIVSLVPGEWVEYEGTAAQLQAEGLVPIDIEWPPAASARRWKAHGFSCWLQRTRPEGHKGPKRSWLDMDNWFLRVQVTNRDHESAVERYMARKTEAFRADYYRHTPAGQRERKAQRNRYCKAQEDRAFQVFKASFVPELRKPRREAKITLAEPANHHTDEAPASP